MALNVREAFEVEHQPQEGYYFDEAKNLYVGGSDASALHMLNALWACWQKAWVKSRLNLSVEYPATGTLLSPGFNEAVHLCREAVETACGHMTLTEKQLAANKVEGQFDTLRDRVVAAGYGNQYSDEEVAEMRTEMAVLSSRYFDLTGLSLEE